MRGDKKRKPTISLWHGRAAQIADVLKAGSNVKIIYPDRYEYRGPDYPESLAKTNE